MSKARNDFLILSVPSMRSTPESTPGATGRASRSVAEVHFQVPGRTSRLYLEPKKLFVYDNGELSDSGLVAEDPLSEELKLKVDTPNGYPLGPCPQASLGTFSTTLGCCCNE
jgi:hypothetical protein